MTTQTPVHAPAPTPTPVVIAAATETERPGPSRTLRLAAAVALVLVAVVAAVAVIVRLTAARTVRDGLHYPFTGVPATVDEAGRIFSHNAGAMLGVFGVLLIAQLAARRPDGPAAAQRVIRSVCELLLAGVIAANLFVVGAALGAYGTPMLCAVLPHGPVELAAFALALALYLEGRRSRLPLPYLISAGAVSVILLAAAAILETFVEV